MNITKDALVNVFTKAKRDGKGYVGVAVVIGGEKPEIIINPLANIETKLEYYKKTYDKNLNHRFATGIKIIDCVSGDSFQEIEDEMYCL